MLSLMAEASSSSKDEQHEQSSGDYCNMDRTDIKANVLNIIGGAIDSSAATIEWAFTELFRREQVMKNVQQELQRVVGMNRAVEEDDLAKLEYLDMVVKESLRLHPPGPFLLPRESIEDTTVNGYHIPKNSRVIINVWSIGRDTNVWSEDAHQFNPERFRGSTVDVFGQDFQLIPFGSGRSGCPAIKLGLTVVRLVLAQLVHCFDWRLPNAMLPAADSLDMTGKFGISRSSDLLVIPTFRLKNNFGSF